MWYRTCVYYLVYCSSKKIVFFSKNMQKLSLPFIIGEVALEAPTDDLFASTDDLF